MPPSPLYSSQRRHCGQGWIIETICVNSKRITILRFNFKAFWAEVTVRKLLQISACWEMERPGSSLLRPPDTLLPCWEVDVLLHFHAPLPERRLRQKELSGIQNSYFRDLTPKLHFILRVENISWIPKSGTTFPVGLFRERASFSWKQTTSAYGSVMGFEIYLLECNLIWFVWSGK